MKRLTVRRQQLAVYYMPLALSRGVKWGRIAGHHREDMIGAALLGLCLAASRFNRRMGTFPAYARETIDGTIRHELRTMGRFRGQLCDSLQTKDWPAPDEDGGYPELYEAIETLSSREADVVYRVAWGRQSVREIGAAVGLDPSNVTRAWQRALAKLRTALSTDCKAP